MYFGIGQKEKSLAEIAVLTKTNPLKVKMDLQDILKNINNPYKYIYSKHLYNMRRKCIAKVGRYFPTNLLKLISINLYGV